MLILGIPCGLLAAISQAWSYLISRDLVAEGHCSPLRLLGLGHFWLGLLAAIALPIFYQLVPVSDWSAVWPPMLLGLSCYLAAQTFFYTTVRLAPASRIAPLMGLKVALIAVLVSVFGVQELGIWHWLAVGLTLLATVAVNYAGGSVGWRAMIGVLLTVSAFAGSDMGIQLLLQQLDAEPGVIRSIFGISLVYSAGLIIALLVLAVSGGRPRRRECAGSLRYALAWTLSMLGFFIAIDVAGVVLAVMLQSLRGPFTIMFGALAARLGRTSAEQDFDRRSLLRQICAAIFMTAATVIWAVAG